LKHHGNEQVIGIANGIVLSIKGRIVRTITNAFCRKDTLLIISFLREIGFWPDKIPIFKVSFFIKDVNTKNSLSSGPFRIKPVDSQRKLFYIRNRNR